MTANYGHLLTDEETGPPFVTEIGTGRKLYRHPLCDLCGSPRYSHDAVLLPCDEKCPSFPAAVREMFA